MSEDKKDAKAEEEEKVTVKEEPMEVEGEKEGEDIKVKTAGEPQDCYNMTPLCVCMHAFVSWQSANLFSFLWSKSPYDSFFFGSVVFFSLHAGGMVEPERDWDDEVDVIALVFIVHSSLVIVFMTVIIISLSEDGKKEESQDAEVKEEKDEKDKGDGEKEKQEDDVKDEGKQDADGKSQAKEEEKQDEKEKKAEVKEEKSEDTKQQDDSYQKFMFNIADGGFTELHTLWANEQRALQAGREHEVWHRRHDFWLLTGIVTYPWAYCKILVDCLGSKEMYFFFIIRVTFKEDLFWAECCLLVFPLKSFDLMVKGQVPENSRFEVLGFGNSLTYDT